MEAALERDSIATDLRLVTMTASSRGKNSRMALASIRLAL